MFTFYGFENEHIQIGTCLLNSTNINIIPSSLHIHTYIYIHIHTERPKKYIHAVPPPFALTVLPFDEVALTFM
jgi:hypothetical protein